MTVDLAAPGTARRLPKRRSGEAVAGLVDAAAAGEQGAWNALVQEFVGLLWAVARAHRLCDADAADVVQATWLRLFEHLGRLHEPARVGAWLATTARRECLRTLREHGRAAPFGDDAPECESCDPRPGEDFSSCERDDALWRGFARLRSTRSGVAAPARRGPAADVRGDRGRP